MPVRKKGVGVFSDGKPFVFPHQNLRRTVEVFYPHDIECTMNCRKDTMNSPDAAIILRRIFNGTLAGHPAAAGRCRSGCICAENPVGDGYGQEKYRRTCGYAGCECHVGIDVAAGEVRDGNRRGVTPMTITGLRVAGAMALFWTASLFGQRERVASADMLKLFRRFAAGYRVQSGVFYLRGWGFHRRWMPRLSPPVCRCWPWSSPRSI